MTIQDNDRIVCIASKLANARREMEEARGFVFNARERLEEEESYFDSCVETVNVLEKQLSDAINETAKPKYP